MCKLIIEDRAIGFLKQTLEKENASAVRIFIGGGGCCKWFEIAPVEKGLLGDVTFNQGGITIYIEKDLVEKAKTIEIIFEERNGLRIEFNGQNKNGESINKTNS